MKKKGAKWLTIDIVTKKMHNIISRRYQGHGVSGACSLGEGTLVVCIVLIPVIVLPPSWAMII